MTNTNYKRRYKLLKSRLTRVVFRISTKYAYAQLVDYDNKGDHVIYSTSTKIFGKYKKNKESCHELGLIIGNYIEKNCQTTILDIGRKKFHTLKILQFVKGIHNVTNKVKINMEKIKSINLESNNVE